MNLTIIDDAISKGYQNLVENDFCSSYSSWYYNEHITDKNPQSNDTNSGFSHIIFAETKKSEYYALVYPILLEALDKYQKGVLVNKLFYRYLLILIIILVLSFFSRIHYIQHDL